MFFWLPQDDIDPDATTSSPPTFESGSPLSLHESTTEAEATGNLFILLA
jgi:hypothetical protein